MDRKHLYTLLLSFWCIAALAQPHDVVSASGASFSNSSGYLSYTIGECISGTLSSATLTITQGFLQTGLPKSTRGVPVISLPEIEISVFPNPVKDQLFLHTGDPQGLYYLLFDVKGRLIERAQVLNERTEIDFSALQPSVYILRVTDNKEVVRLFQIIKH
jgi:Secretion system C-terminal sorting domain